VNDEIIFFASQGELRKWLAKNHVKLTEQWIGFYKKGSGKPSITWPESVDEALCFGWIDGIRKSIDDESYKIRFTPRKPRSIWSAVNIKRANELIELGLMMPSGLAEFEKRDDARSRVYAYEQKNVVLDKTFVTKFKKNKKAWDFFETQPPSYRRVATHWIMSAKQEVTREKRLATLIEDSAASLRIAQLRRSK
jgi:uncharacterized protein YdeI (YjbR/CyaY-like superfamily)